MIEQVLQKCHLRQHFLNNLELILQPQVAYWNLHLQDLQQILALYDQLLDQLMEIKIYPNRYFQASFLKAMQNYLKVCFETKYDSNNFSGL
jgi:hypothetical protein